MTELRIPRRTFLALTLAACGDGVVSPFLPPIPGPLQRGPQVALVDETSALVAFRSDFAGVGAIEFGETLAPGSRQVGGIAREHSFVLDGLRPGTIHHYRVELAGEILSEGHAFRTFDPSAPLRFAVLGDSGTGLADQLDIAALMRDWSPDLILHTGDMVYEDGAPDELDPKYFLPYRDLIDHVPVYVALGNHDVRYDGGRTLLDALYMPSAEAYYSFERGDVHFVALDSTADLAIGSVQHDWLAADLAATSARFTVVFLHHPPYTSGPREDLLALRAAICPLFDAHGVDLVFAGHDHLYHRSLPIFDGLPGSGTIYVVTGGGGRHLYESTPRSFTAAHESAYHFCGVEIVGPSLTLTAIRSDGTTLDQVTLTEGG